MKTVTITQAKRGLSDLLAKGQAVEVTSHGRTVGTLRVFAQAKVDREKAKEAARGIREIGMKYKPSKKHGGTAELRKIRDHGE